ncbi:MAG: FMN-dependent NADH-azoreductase [Oceanospirillaceae bacterium]|uniref:FMN-dependent NADH-azoreductase n=1 Tax=Neptuniibacter sp. UBA847 TaxID=1946977 RepID=UPI000C46BFEB|nr:NAD(P)H-dependent oxidoreductase [Neptuniibacter sp. UBA847]MAY40884.1 FMN-dependent NADH-azoreductase [Oceanospirillaceae bacterium]|tara:strand:- start:8272 stop:8868 length:597 start_codon:yes stop_codon:yes gene_type:complete
MANLLHIKSSIFGDSGKSSQLATKFIDDWKMQNPQGEVVVRDLVADDLPHLDSFVISALTTPHDERTDDQQALVDRSDQLIAEIKAADQIVMGVPMYNFAVPSQMKSYFDLLARAGVTFNYTENGPVGLIGDKPVYLIATRGGLYKENGIDFQIPFVQQFLSFIGLNSVEVIYAEGLNMADISGSSYKEAYQQIGSIH